MKRDYSFCVWPEEGTWEQPMYEVFRNFTRMEMTFTPLEWSQFCASLERSGFTVREADSRSHDEWKAVGL